MELAAKVGDEIVIDGHNVGAPPREGEILEVLGEGETAHFRVLWDDGQECIFFPGSDARIVHFDEH